MEKPNLQREIQTVVIHAERISIWLTRKEIVQKAYCNYLKKVPDVSQEELEREDHLLNSLQNALSNIGETLQMLSYAEQDIHESLKV